MTNLTFFIITPILSLTLLAINLLISPQNPYPKNNSAFKCDFFFYYLYKLYPVILKYFPVLSDYINTFGFIHSLHILLNILYFYMNTCLNI